eukprot:jgi/Bigna1/135214/aug1.28_g9922
MKCKEISIILMKRHATYHKNIIKITNYSLTDQRRAPPETERLSKPKMGLMYNTVRFAQIPNTCLALLHYTLIFSILTYVSLVSVWLHKGYQTFDEVQGTATLKVKGSGISNTGMIFDSYDLVVPAIQPGELFITTNYWLTSNQTREICNGSEDDGLCSKGCEMGKFTDNGRLTGRCFPNSQYCEVEGWCPVENINKKYKGNIINNIGDWTILLRSDVKFPKFGASYSNARDEIELGKNLFKVEDILKKTGYSYNATAAKGGVFAVNFHFDCNLDDPTKCMPDVKMSRLDIPGSASYGFNYREATYTTDSHTTATERNLKKRYGLRFIFGFSGQAGKFDPVALLVTLGAGAGLLGVATLVCDMVINYFLDPERTKAYKKQIFEEVKYAGDDDEKDPLVSQTNRVTCGFCKKRRRKEDGDVKLGGSEVRQRSVQNII